MKATWMMAGLLLAALPAQAQPCGTRTGGAPTLTAGQTVRGALAREDYTLPGDRYDGRDACTGRPYDSYFYEAQAGEQLTFVLESREIDPEVTATTHWRGGGAKDVVEQRGRRGRTLTATGTVPAAGRILIQVASNVSMGRPGSFGDYSFTVRSNRPSDAPRPTPDAGGGPSIRSGQTVRGELTSSNGTLADDSYFQDHVYTARRGEHLVVGLTSDDFDAFLHVGRRGADGSLENVVSDDDGGGGTNSLVEYTADQNGPVVIRVNTLSAGETGGYSLEVYSTGGGESAQSEPEQPAATLPALRAGQAVRGSLARGDGTLDDGSWYDSYTYTARRGERIVVRMESDEFDTVLGVSAARDDADDMVMDDDGGGGTNSRVEYTATRDGPILIRANALNAGEGGSYTVQLQAAGSAPANDEGDDGDASALTVGRPVQGELRRGGRTLDDGSYYVDYLYQARRGQRVVIRLSSDDFDTVLAVMALGENGQMEAPVLDDDGGGGTNSRVEYTATRDGPLVVRVNSLQAGETGRYTLVVESARGSAAPRAVGPERVAAADPLPLRLGEPARGALGPDSPREADGTPYDLYSYAAHAAEQVIVRMSSDDFDARLSVRGPTRHPAVQSVVDDDDGGGGTNARVDYRALADGPLLIRARGLAADDAGRYTVLVKPAERPSAAPASAPEGAASSARLPSAGPAARMASARAMDGRLVPAAARPFSRAGLPRGRMPVMSNRAQAWLLVAAGVGLILGGKELEDTSEPVGALIRYTGYAAIVLAPIGG